MRSWVLACAVAAACSDKRPAPGASGSDKGSESGSARSAVTTDAGSGGTSGRDESSGSATGSAAASGSDSDGASGAARGSGSASAGGSGSGATASLEAHKLFQCAMTSGDQALIVRVTTKLGLSDAKGAPNDKFQGFVKLHGDWVRSNLTKLKELAPTPAAAKTCAEAGLK